MGRSGCLVFSDAWRDLLGGDVTYEIKDFLWTVAEYAALVIVFIAVVFCALYFINRIREEVRKM